MARITLDQSRARLRSDPHGPDDYALKEVAPCLGTGRRLCAARTVGLRQDDAAQHHLRPRDARRADACCSTTRRDRPADGGAQHRAGLPVPGRLRHA